MNSVHKRQRRQSNALYVCSFKLRDITEDWLVGRSDDPESYNRLVIDPLRQLHSDIQKIASELALDSGVKQAGYSLPYRDYIPNSKQGIYSGNPETVAERRERRVRK